MEWSRTATLPLADLRCTSCHGLGLRGGRLDATQPCNCVLRGIFRACYQRFQTCLNKEKSLSQVRFDGASTQSRRGCWGRKEEEFVADFLLVSRRSLTPAEHQLFRFHFLLGADWRLCCTRLKLEKGAFFHCLYRIEQKLGRIFRELEPYPLHPVDEYFNGVVLEHNALRVTSEPTYRLRPPVNGRRRTLLDLPGSKAA